MSQLLTRRWSSRWVQFIKKQVQFFSHNVPFISTRE
jgi:hypothetical protein